MKKAHTTRTFFSFCLFLTIILIMSVSCKKKTDDTPTPTPTPPKPGKYPTSIDFQNFNFRTEKEISQGKALHTYLLGRAALCLDDDDDGPDLPPDLGLSGEILKDIYNFNHPNNKFAIIDNQLIGITNQLTEIQSELQTISQEIISGTVDVENWITQQAIYTQMVDIYTKFQDTTSQYALQYFPSMAARIQRGDPTAITWTMLQGYAQQYYNANNNSTMQDDVNSMAGQILDNDALLLFTKEIILNGGNATNANQPANLLNAYYLLENYFLEIVNYQLQGMTIVSNVDNYADTTGKTWQNTLQGFKVMFQKEIAEFLSTVNYLSVNLYDYRNTDQFTNDAAYWQMGLAPNQNFLAINARAQFVCNVILDGFSLPYTTEGGVVVVPQMYGGEVIVNSAINTLTVSYGGFGEETDSAEILSSQFLNTYYTDIVAQASNKWSIFNFSDTSHAVTPGSNPFVIQAGSTTNPWPHSITIQGTYQVQYYNPQTGKSQATKDSVYYMPFGYFATVWWWGGQICQGFGLNRFTDYLVYQYSIHGGTLYATNNMPCLGTTDSDNNFYPHSQYNSNFSLSQTYASYEGMACSTDHYCYMTDAWYWSLSTSAPSSPCYAFVYYNIIDPLFSGNACNFQVYAGTNLSLNYAQDGANFTNNDIFQFFDSSPTNHLGTSKALVQNGQSLQLNIGYQLQLYGSTASANAYGLAMSFLPTMVFTQTQSLP